MARMKDKAEETLKSQMERDSLTTAIITSVIISFVAGIIVHELDKQIPALANASGKGTTGGTTTPPPPGGIIVTPNTTTQGFTVAVHGAVPVQIQYI